MRPYLASFRLGAREFGAYRGALVLALVVEVILLVAAYYLWRAVFAASLTQQVGGYAFPRFLLYLAARFTAGPPWGYFGDSVRTGEVIHALLQPVRLEHALLARQLGRKLAGLSVSVPTFGLVALLFGGDLTGGMNVLGFALCLLLAGVGAHFFEFLVSLSAFYTTAQQGVHEAKLLAVTLLSGALFPLEALPAPLAAMVAWLPFQAFVSASVRVLLQEQEVFQTVLLQLLWTLILAVVSAWGLARVRGRIDLQGG